MKKDIFSSANSRVSLFVQALLGERSGNGKCYENVAFTLRERDADNRAIRTVEFHLGALVAEVWGYDLLPLNLARREFLAEKSIGGSGYRSLLIRAEETGGVRLSILNGTKDNVLFINLDPDARRALGRAICRIVAFYHAKLNEAAFSRK